MKIKDIFESSTTSGSIAPVSMPMNAGNKKRQANVGQGVYGKTKVGNLLTGKSTSKKFANSVSEAKKKVEKKPTKVEEAELKETDIIVPADKKAFRNSGFVKPGEDDGKRDTELLQHIIVNAESILNILAQNKNKGVDEWIKSAIAKANSLLGSINSHLNSKISPKEGALGAVAGGAIGGYATKSLKGAATGAKIGSKAQDLVGGVIAGGGAMEGKKADRMVKHVAKSERNLGKSKKEAENIAWATANKRGMLNNKNHKKGK